MNRDHRHTLKSTSLRRLVALTGMLGALGITGAGQAGCSSDAALHEDHEERAGNASSAQIVSSRADKALTVEVELSTMIADQITNEPGPLNTRDETYLLIEGTAPNGHPDTRLPLYRDNDDYYEFWNLTTRTDVPNDPNNHWTNQDQINVGYPRIWNGTLQVDESADFVVQVMEQEDKQLQYLKKAVDAICGGIKVGIDVAGAIGAAAPALPDGGKSGGDGGKGDGGGGSSGTAADVIAECHALAALLPDTTTDDIIGVFEITLKNVGGTLAVNTVPLSIPGADVTRQATGDAQRTYQAIQEKNGKLVDTFRMTGAGSQYLLDVAVKATPTITNPLRYYGNTNDACREDSLRVAGINGSVSVPQGATADVRLASSLFYWTCDGSNEQSRCDDGTDYVRVVHDASGGGIHWTCFKEDMTFSKKLGDGLYQQSGNPIVWRLNGDTDCYVRSAAEEAEFQVATPRTVTDLGEGHSYIGGCAYPHCGDGVKDSTETGVDCGSALCAPCGVGGGCNVASDCSTNICNAVSHVCVTSHCQDSTQDADETGIDCGGASCTACPVFHCPTGTRSCGGKVCVRPPQVCP